MLSSAISCRSSVCPGCLSTAWLVSLVIFPCMVSNCQCIYILFDCFYLVFLFYYYYYLLYTVLTSPSGDNKVLLDCIVTDRKISENYSIDYHHHFFVKPRKPFDNCPIYMWPSGNKCICFWRVFLPPPTPVVITVSLHVTVTTRPGVLGGPHPVVRLQRTSDAQPQRVEAKEVLTSTSKALLIHGQAVNPPASSLIH